LLAGLEARSVPDCVPVTFAEGFEWLLIGLTACPDIDREAISEFCAAFRAPPRLVERAILARCPYLPQEIH